ncbi:MAG TPA: transporter [Methylocella sp.]|nr:transporter [Methylocella sp.]
MDLKVWRFYYYQQLTADGGSGDKMGAFRGRVAAIGPLLSYIRTRRGPNRSPLAAGCSMSSTSRTGSKETRSSPPSASGCRHAHG